MKARKGLCCDSQRFLQAFWLQSSKPPTDVYGFVDWGCAEQIHGSETDGVQLGYIFLKSLACPDEVVGSSGFAARPTRNSRPCHVGSDLLAVIAV